LLELVVLLTSCTVSGEIDVVCWGYLTPIFILGASNVGMGREEERAAFWSAGVEVVAVVYITGVCLDFGVVWPVCETSESLAGLR